MATQRHHFDVFADYHQFYIQDEPVEGNLGDSWTPEATERLLALAPGTVGVGTVRNMTVPVDIEIYDRPLDESLDAWDQVNECTIQIESGRIVVAGCTDYFPDAARRELSCNQAAIAFGSTMANLTPSVPMAWRVKITTAWQCGQAHQVQQSF